MIGNKIITVCLANVCRSPAVEAFLKKSFPEYIVSSAGIKAAVGHGADKLSCKVMKEHYQIDIHDHSAQQLVDSMLKENDLILTMDSGQTYFLEKHYPFAAGKIHRLGKWRDKNIDDPYQKPEIFFQETIELINCCVKDWLERIGKK